MADIYYNLVKAGRRTIDQIPVHLQAEVQGMIDAENTTN
ncbi:CD1375 family protein [Brevibacillus sp. HB1.4B]|nr:CD1375 family protein [Brevibacillus sp. HB1.4B]